MSKLAEFVSNFDENIVLADGLDYAFVGLAESEHGLIAVYSTERIVSHLMDEDMMDFETAEEFMQFNIISAYAGDRTPIFINVIPREFWDDESAD